MFMLFAALPLEKIYLSFGLFGASIFIIRMVLMLIGADGSDADIGDVDVDADIDAGDVDDSELDIDAGLHILTVQGLMAFVMMFGFTGYAMSSGATVGTFLTMLASTTVGIFTMWLVARLLTLMKSLQNSGTVSLSSAVGGEGSVYLSIPAGGIGKVSVKVGQSLKVVDAVCEDKQIRIETGERVSVTGADGGRHLIVKRI